VDDDAVGFEPGTQWQRASWICRVLVGWDCATMQEAYKQAQKGLLSLRKDVQDYADDPAAPVERERELANQLEGLAATLAALSKSSPPEQQKEMWKQKIGNAIAEQKMISSTLREVCRKRDASRAEEEHKKGLHDRRYNLDSVLLDNEYKVNESGACLAVRVCASTDMLGEAANSTNMVAQYIDMGRSVVEEFRRQRGILDAVQSRMIEYARLFLVFLTHSLLDTVRGTRWACRSR
jgi:hypothetical protein